MAYFNNAATTYPKPEQVYNAIIEQYKETGFNSSRGNNSQSSDLIIEETRNKLKNLLHGENKEVIFQPSTTIALNLILNSLIKKNNIKNIYISPFEHNAITRTLSNLKKEFKINIFELKFNKNLKPNYDEIKYQFFKNPPDLIVISHVSNVIGLILPVLELFKLAKKSNDAWTILDMAQSAGIVDIDLNSELVDFAVFAGHKTLYGPLGLSGFLMKPEINLEPLYFGGTGIDSANQEMPTELPIRLEAGSQNLPGIFGLNAALDWMLQIKSKDSQILLNKEKNDRKQLIDILNQYDFINIIGNNLENNYLGIISCQFDNLSNDEAEKILEKLNITIRSGLHCSPNAHSFLGTFPEGTIRFSTSYFTSKEDFNELSTALEVIDLNF